MLSYRIAGDGPPLVLIHGWGITFDIWRNLAPLLQPHFQLIMVELPGVGDSPPAPDDRPYYVACADALAELLRHLEIEQILLLAYSTGTRAADTFIQHYPDYVTRVVLLCPVYPKGLRALSMRMVLYVDRRAPRWGTWLLRGWRLHAIVRVFGFNGQRSPYLHDWLREIRTQPVDSLKATLHDIPRYDRTALPLSPRQALFIWGQRDLITRKPARPLPNDRVIRINHSAPVCFAREIAREIVPFLKGDLPDQGDMVALWGQRTPPMPTDEPFVPPSRYGRRWYTPSERRKR